ncbi:hypothetical protein ACOMHN_066795 [Nucella lapillus]
MFFVMRPKPSPSASGYEEGALVLCCAPAGSSRYDTHIVFLAIAITAVVTLSLTIFAIQTKIDFTLCSGVLCVMTMVVIMMGFFLSLASFVIGYSRVNTEHCVR